MASEIIDLTASSSPSKSNPFPPSLSSRLWGLLDPSLPINIALKNTSHSTLVSVIRTLIARHPEMEQWVTEELITEDKNVKGWEDYERSYHSGDCGDETSEVEESEDEDEDEDGSGDENDKTSSKAQKSVTGELAIQPVEKKRLAEDTNLKKRLRYAMCENCEEEFDVQYNRKSECRFHDGELDVEWDEWPDHDEFTHGPIDTPENQKLYPEKFTWSCCEKSGDDEGCRVGMHKEKISKRVKL